MAQEIEDGGFAKIYGDRLEGSSLMECRVATRWCFLFMGSTANARGFFRCANAAALARRANVTFEEAELAIQELEAPDPDSSTPDNEGRRIVRVQGGWEIVTHQFYRNLRSSKQLGDAERQQNKREREREASQHVTQRHAPSQKVALELEAEGELEADPRRGEPARAREETPPADEIDPHEFTAKLIAEANHHLPRLDLKPHPAISFAVANLLAVGHPKGIAFANGRGPLAREDLVDALHGWIIAEAADPWHRSERACGKPFTFSRLVTEGNRLAEYAERGRGRAWADWLVRVESEGCLHGIHGLEHARAPPIETPVNPEITARHHAREAERLERVKAWREEKPPAGMPAREERKWWDEHKRRRP